MELTDRQRLRRLAEALDAAPDGCPECGAGSGRYALQPMRLNGDKPQPEAEPAPGPCPVCGAEPIRLLPMRLDGNIDLNDTAGRGS